MTHTRTHTRARAHTNTRERERERERWYASQAFPIWLHFVTTEYIVHCNCNSYYFRVGVECHLIYCNNVIYHCCEAELLAVNYKRMCLFLIPIPLLIHHQSTRYKKRPLQLPTHNPLSRTLFDSVFVSGRDPDQNLGLCVCEWVRA